MATPMIHCPFCNGSFPRPTTASGRVQCPRCEEMFYLTETTKESLTEDATPGDQGITSTFSNPEAPPSTPQPRTPEVRRTISNGAMAFLVLGVMGMMALIGLAFAWRTVLVRRSQDYLLPKTQALEIPVVVRVALGIYVLVLLGSIVRGWNRRERERGAAAASEPWWNRHAVPLLATFVLLFIGVTLIAIQTRPVRRPTPTDSDAVAPVLPSQLAGLGYLPSDVNLVVAIHVAEAGETSAGRQFLERFTLDNDEVGLSTVLDWTKLGLRELDHVVLGVKMENVLFPRCTIVVRTKEAYDEVNLRELDLKARSFQKTAGRTIYRFTLPGKTQEAFLWCPNNRTLVISWPDSMKDFPVTPREGIGHFSKEIGQVIKDRIEVSANEQPAQFWVAGHVNWERTPLVKVFLVKTLPTRDWETLLQVQSLGAWAHFDQDAVLHAIAQTASPEAAKKLEASLTGNKEGGQPHVPFVKQKSSNKPFVEDLEKSLKITREGAWITVEGKILAETIKTH